MTRHFVANGALFGLLGLLPGYAEAQVQVSINIITKSPPATST